MSWESFCEWWNTLFWELGQWFTNPSYGGGISNLGRIIAALILAVGGHYLVKLLMMGIRKIAGVKKRLQIDISVKSFVISLINITLHLTLVIFIFIVLNVNMTSVAAVVSAGTVAIGLSLQNLISSFASGIILLQAKYFKTGDYIEIRHSDGACEGHVLRVNLITTSLRTYDGYEITIPNDKITKGVITNFTKEKNRRVVIKFNVDYSTDIEQLKEVIYKVINADERVVNKPAPYVHVASLQQHGVEVNAKFWVPFGVYWDAMFDISERILLALKDKKVKIPYHNIRLINDQEKPNPNK